MLIGGGKGLKATLEAIGDSEENLIVFSIVDSGGDTGKIRKEYPNVIPIGDVKKIIWGLRPEIEYDFYTTKEHKFWNELIFELVNKCGINEGLNYLRKMLRIKSKIYPSSISPSNLFAKTADNIITGEYEIETIQERIYEVWLDPKVKVNPILQSFELNDVIMSPGSIYGSLISNLLIDGFTELLENKRKILIVNGICKLEHIKNIGDYVNEFKRYGYVPDIVIAPKGMDGVADYFVRTENGLYNVNELRKALEEIL